MIYNLICLARPQDWVKNVFILLPLPFAAAAGKHVAPTTLLLGLLGFCLISSAVYTFNDLCDAAADRLHPEKRRRPIAAGKVSPAAAFAQITVLLALGLTLCWATHSATALTIAMLYVGLNLAYNLGAKHLPLLDVFLLASGYLLRVLLGCALADATPSPWLLLCTSTLALFLGFAKRRADLIDELDVHHRPSLRGYSREFLDQAVGICAGVAMLSYALYCVESRNAILAPGRELASLPPVAFGILNYLRLVYVEGAGGSPVKLAYRSPTMQLCGLVWLAAIAWSLGRW